MGGWALPGGGTSGWEGGEPWGGGQHLWGGTSGWVGGHFRVRVLPVGREVNLGGGGGGGGTF